MTEPLERNEIIELLNKLGSEADADVLAAAREMHERVVGNGMTWDELLVPENADDDDDVAVDDDDFDDEEDDDVPPGKKAEQNAATLALIDELLARSGNSDDLIEELTEYKEQIADDDFYDGDHRYVRALHKRLTGG